MFQPELPRFFGNIFIHSLAELARPRDAIEARHFLPKFHAVDHSRAGLDRLARYWLRAASVVSHAVLLGTMPFSPYCNLGKFPSRLHLALNCGMHSGNVETPRPVGSSDKSAERRSGE